MCYSVELVQYWSQHLDTTECFEEDDMLLYSEVEKLDSPLMSEAIILSRVLLRSLIVSGMTDEDLKRLTIVAYVATSLAIFTNLGGNPVTILAETIVGMSTKIPRGDIDAAVLANQERIGMIVARLIDIRQKYPLVLGGAD